MSRDDRSWHTAAPGGTLTEVERRAPDTHRPIGLASWLGGGSVFIVLVAVAAMALTCAIVLHRLVQQQALVRVQLAVTSARELLHRSGEDALTDARRLAQDPTLLRLLAEHADEQIPPLLQRFCESQRYDVCVVRRPSQVLSAGAAAPAVPWLEVATANREQGERFMLAPHDGSPPLFGAAVTLPDQSGDQVILFHAASPAWLGILGPQVGAQLQLLNFVTYHALASNPFTALHTQALTSGRVAASRLSGEDSFGATVAIATTGGEVIALLDARLAAAEFAATAAAFDRILIFIALLVAAGAGIAGVFYGRWLAQPVVALRDVALRIGRGDLTAAVPAVAPLEVGALASSMEEMRRNLIELTGTLRRREAEAQALLKGIVEGVFAVDSERRIRYVNPQTLVHLGRTESEIIGHFCGDVLKPQAVDGARPCEHACPILQARGAGQSTARETLCLNDGRRRNAIIVSSAPVGGIQVQVMRDETDLEAARRARDSVLGNISHEFRTPLAAQLASIELLRDGLDNLPVESQRELLTNVERGVLRLMRLIDNLLESVRIESGQVDIRHQTVELPDIVHEAADLMAPLLAQRNLDLDLDVDHLVDPVKGDAQRLIQVLVNLLSNAAKFAPQSSRISIGGRTLERSIEFWVEDAGPGVDAASRMAIFERFKRAEGAEPDAPGLGLGLWIVKSIVERHQGSVRFERVDNARTRFTVGLPRELNP
jgi:signal transduction histidine kinase/HAMP domain-containing protein